MLTKVLSALDILEDEFCYYVRLEGETGAWKVADHLVEEGAL